MFSELVVCVKSPEHLRIMLHFNLPIGTMRICNKRGSKQSFTHAAEATLGQDVVREDVFMAGKGISSTKRTSYPAGRQLLRGKHCSIV